MNSSSATHPDPNVANSAAPDFASHDQAHFNPDLNFQTHPSFPHTPPSAGPNAVEQRRLAPQTPVNPSGRPSRKRKTSAANLNGISDGGPNYIPAGDFSPGGAVTSGDEGSPGMSHTGRPLNPGKRAEQNRKAQRAFRERREVHVKELEARSQLLDAALGSADEANRRWEECRALVDSLRVENGGLRAEINGLRAALGNAAVAAAQFQQHVQHQQQQPGSLVNGASGSNGEDGSPNASNDSTKVQGENTVDGAVNA